MQQKINQSTGEIATKFVRQYRRDNPNAPRSAAYAAADALLKCIGHSHPKTLEAFHQEIDRLYGWPPSDGSISAIDHYFGDFMKRTNPCNNQ